MAGKKWSRTQTTYYTHFPTQASGLAKVRATARETSLRAGRIIASSWVKLQLNLSQNFRHFIEIVRSSAQGVAVVTCSTAEAPGWYTAQATRNDAAAQCISFTPGHPGTSGCAKRIRMNITGNSAHARGYILIGLVSENVEFGRNSREHI